MSIHYYVQRYLAFAGNLAFLGSHIRILIETEKSDSNKNAYTIESLDLCDVLTRAL